MLTPSYRLGKASPDALLMGRDLLVFLVLSLLLSCVSLVPLVGNIHYNWFIRSLELAFAGWVLVYASSRNQAPALSRATAWLFIWWLGATLLSAVQATHFWPALTRQAEWLTHILFAVTLWGAFLRTPSLLKVVLLMIPLGFFLVGIHTLAFWFAHPDPQAYNWFERVPLVGHVRHFGYYALAGLLFSAAPLLSTGTRSRKYENALAFLGMAFCWGFIFWSGGRAAMGAGLLGIAFMVWFTERKQRPASLLLSIGALALGLWLSMLFGVDDPRLGFAESLTRTATDTSASGINGFSTGRLNIWREALQAWAAHPWLGLGPDNYRLLPPQTHGGIQPHSLFIQVLVDWGLLGALPFLALLGTACWQGLVRLLREADPLRRTARTTAVAFIIGATAHSLVDGLYYHPHPLLFLITCFAIALLPAASAETTRPPVVRWLTARPVLIVAVGLLAAFFFMTGNTFYRWLL